MNTIHALMQSIFTIYIMKDISNSSLSGNDNCLIIIFVIIYSFHSLRTNKKRIFPFIFCFISVTTTSSNFSYFANK